MKSLVLVAGVLTMIAAPANALTATAVRITNALPTWLQVAEVQAFQGATNVALSSAGAVATGTGNFSATSSPDKANDGSTNGSFPNIYHSDSPNGSEFLLVTFSQAYDITTLTVFGRTDCCSGRDVFNFELLNGASVVASGSLDATGASHSATTTFAPSAGVVPEPASWALMIGGFGLVGAAMRRRTATAVIAA